MFHSPAPPFCNYCCLPEALVDCCGLGQRCFDFNECYNDICANGGTCRNTPDSYECTCTYGYTGTNCEEEINACSQARCENNARCVVSGDTYSCDCRPGFTGAICDVDVDECLVNSELCGQFDCVNTHGSFYCLCPRGYTGLHCNEDIDECLDANTCPSNKRCANVAGSYGCVCDDPYPPGCDVADTAEAVAHHTADMQTPGTTATSGPSLTSTDTLPADTDRLDTYYKTAFIICLVLSIMFAITAVVTVTAIVVLLRRHRATTDKPQKTGHIAIKYTSDGEVDVQGARRATEKHHAHNDVTYDSIDDVSLSYETPECCGKNKADLA